MYSEVPGMIMCYWFSKIFSSSRYTVLRIFKMAAILEWLQKAISTIQKLEQDFAPKNLRVTFSAKMHLEMEVKQKDPFLKSIKHIFNSILLQSVKYLYMTGDLISHNIWETTKENNIRQIQEQADAFKTNLGTDVVILPVLGNHEPHPSNV